MYRKSIIDSDGPIGKQLISGDEIIDSSRSKCINDMARIFLKPKKAVVSAIFVLFVLLTPHLWAESQKEYIYLDGKIMAVETGATNCGPYSTSEDSEDPDEPVGKTGGESSFTVHGGGGGCPWTAESDDHWITVTEGGGNVSKVKYLVEPNDGLARTGTITITDPTNINNPVQYEVKQVDGCDQTLSSYSNNSIDFVGGTWLITVNTGAECAWTATKNVDWITVNGGGNGSGSVSYTAAANPGGHRTGKITIGNKEFTIAQGEHCQVGCTSSSAQCSYPYYGLPSCADKCYQDAWDYCNGYIDVSECQVWYQNCVSVCEQEEQNFCGNKDQECATSCNAQCGYAIYPQSISGASSGGTSGTINVSSAACNWTAVSNVTSTNKWLQITYGASGTGNGVVGYSISKNNGIKRSDTLTIAGKTFTVSQDDGCTYDIPSESNSTAVSSAGKSGTLVLSRSDSSCLFPTVISNDLWITATVNSGNVDYQVESNTDPSTRIGTITIDGKTFTITQSACTYSISPTSAVSASVGGNQTAIVECSGTLCNWTATKNVDWITFPSDSSGTDTQELSYKVTGNTGASTRTGTITVGGQTLTITQSACTYFISPESVNYGNGAESNSVLVNASSPTCVWAATSNASSWLTVPPDASGTGSDTLVYSVFANSGPARAGTITIAGSTFTVNQANGCTYSLSSASSGTISINGGSGSFAVSTDNACTWTVSNNGWIDITGGNGGTGSGQVGYSVGSNNGNPPRSGNITAGGQNYAVSQDGLPCQQICSNQFQDCQYNVQWEIPVCLNQCEQDAYVYCNGYTFLPECQDWYNACASGCESQVYSSCQYQYDQCYASCN